MSNPKQLSKHAFVFALILGIAAHLSWGSYPVIAKKLLLALPPFALISSGYIVVLLIMSPIILKYSWKESLTSRHAWILMLVGAIRMVTNILSIQSTKAAYVQLINLLTPFVVALIGRAFFREAIPPYTFPALAISSIGSVLVIIREPSLAIFQDEWQIKDTIGISLAMGSNVFLAFYVLLTRHEQSTRGINAIVLFSQQCVVLMVTSIIASICLREDWNSWLLVSKEIWLLFACFIIINLIVGNLLQINSLNNLGATLFTSLMGARLVAALALSALLLNEPLKSWWQVLGATMVFMSIMIYMLLQTNSKTDK